MNKDIAKLIARHLGIEDNVRLRITSVQIRNFLSDGLWIPSYCVIDAIKIIMSRFGRGKSIASCGVCGDISMYYAKRCDKCRNWICDVHIDSCSTCVAQICSTCAIDCHICEKIICNGTHEYESLTPHCAACEKYLQVCNSKDCVGLAKCEKCGAYLCDECRELCDICKSGTYTVCNGCSCYVREPIVCVECGHKICKRCCTYCKCHKYVCYGCMHTCD